MVNWVWGLSLSLFIGVVEGGRDELVGRWMGGWVEGRWKMVRGCGVVWLMNNR